MIEKLFLSVDIEGMNGIVSHKQCYIDHGEAARYQLAVEQMVRESSVVIETALENGVIHVLVNDAHAHMRNMPFNAFEKFGAAVSLLSGKPKFPAMIAGLDDTFDAVCLLGYHGRAGSQSAVLAHSFHSQFFEVALNGQAVGEAELNTLYANLIHDVPVVLLSGDQVVSKQIRSFASQHSLNIQTVVTKYSLSFSAAENYPWVAVAEQYRTATKSFLDMAKEGHAFGLAQIDPPYTLKLTMLNPLGADLVGLLPGAKRLDGTAVEFTHKDFATLFATFQTAYALFAYEKTL